MQSDFIRTHSHQGILKVKWSDILSSNLHVANVRDSAGELLVIPLGAKLTNMVVIPCDEATKKGLELLDQVYTMIGPQNLSTKARLYLGSSMIPAEQGNVDTYPAGARVPMNTKTSHSFLRPAYTSDNGRAIGDMCAPLWINTLLSDCVGLHADPVTHKPKPSLITGIFASFDTDIALQGTKGMKGLVNIEHTKSYFEGELSFSVIYDYVTVSLPTDVRTLWGERTLVLE